MRLHCQHNSDQIKKNVLAFIFIDNQMDMILHICKLTFPFVSGSYRDNSRESPSFPAPLNQRHLFPALAQSFWKT